MFDCACLSLLKVVAPCLFDSVGSVICWDRGAVGQGESSRCIYVIFQLTVALQHFDGIIEDYVTLEKGDFRGGLKDKCRLGADEVR